MHDEAGMSRLLQWCRGREMLQSGLCRVVAAAAAVKTAHGLGHEVGKIESWAACVLQTLQTAGVATRVCNVSSFDVKNSLG